MQHNDFPKGAALVFGGSGGIGQGVAMTFAQCGTDVAIAYRSKKEVAERVAGEIRGTGRKASSTPPTSPTRRRWKPRLKPR